MRALALLPGTVAVAALVLIACNGAAEPPFLAEISPLPSPTATSAPAPTPTAAPETPTPEGECDGMDCFRAFAPLIDAALADGDGSFFADRGVEDEMTCAGDEQLSPCTGQPAGTVLRGIHYNLPATECGCLVPRDRYEAMLADWFARARPALDDEYGSGALTLYALAHRPAGAGSDEAYLAIVTGIFVGAPGPTRREVSVLDFQFLEGSWRLTSDLFDVLDVGQWLSGECADCYDQWERWEGAP